MHDLIASDLWANITQYDLDGHLTVVLTLLLAVFVGFKQHGERVAIRDVMETEAADNAMQVAGANALVKQVLALPTKQNVFQ
mgnify:CR=1 FL=1